MNIQFFWGLQHYKGIAARKSDGLFSHQPLSKAEAASSCFGGGL